jgi:serine/threonine protein kinase/TolB-like protein/Tfp pilus assembly protein PilF
MIGETVSHYRIVGHLGGGGMGVVWRAEDTRLGRQVALKFLPDDMAKDVAALERFQREAQIASALNHPFICTIHDIGEHEGRPFLVMELLDGETLRERISSGQIPIDNVIELAIQVADALDAAHGAGVIHRDIKPGNTFITQRGDAKVLDFGLAKISQIGTASATEMPTAAVAEGLTSPGTTMGTVAYMSPEQARGAELDSRSDLFSLGVVIYEMSTGRKPFVGETAAVVFSEILTKAPISPLRLNPELPEALEEIISRLLEKDPDLRFQTARDLLASLKRLRRDASSGQSVAAYHSTVPPSAASEVSAIASPELSQLSAETGSGSSAGGTPASTPMANRPKTMLIAASMLVVALGAWWIGSRGNDGGTTLEAPSAATADHGPVMVAVLPFDNLGPETETYFAEGMTDEIASRLAGVPGLAVISRQSASAYVGSGATARQIGEELGVGYILEGTVRWARSEDGSVRVRIAPKLVRAADDTQIWTDVYDRELEDVFALQTEIAERAVSAIDSSLLDEAALTATERPTESLEAYDYFLRASKYGLFLMAWEGQDLSLAVDSLEKAVVLDPEFALAHAVLSSAYSETYFSAEDSSQARLLMARRSAERALELEPDLPEGHAAMGIFHYRSRDYESAAEEYEAALEQRPNYPEVLVTLSAIEKRQGRFEKAVEYLLRAERLDPRSIGVKGELAGNYNWLGRVSESIEKADEIRRLEPESLFSGILMSWFQATLGRPEEFFELIATVPDDPRFLGWKFRSFMARRDVESALGYLSERIPSSLSSPARFSRTMRNIAYSQFALGDAEAQRAAALKALPVLEELVRGDATHNVELAEIYALLDRPEASYQAAARASKASEMDFIATTNALLPFARSHVVLGESERAVELIGQWLAAGEGTRASELQLYPLFDSLRERADFQAILD